MLKLLFISLSGRVIKDTDGKLYLNSHMNSKVIYRYRNICDQLTLILRDNCQTVSKSDALKNFNKVPDDVNVIPCTNPYKPIFNVVNPIVKRKIRETIEEHIKFADKVIIAQATGIYANTAIEMCKKYKKKYLIIVGGFSFECDWYNGIKGKIVARNREKRCKENIYNADYVLYVTNEALQNRYPTKGKTLGCSDVEIYSLDSNLLDRRKQRYLNLERPLVIGTMAQLDVKLKGVKYAIEAVALLKDKGYTNFRYEIVGNGNSKELLELIEKFNVKNEVTIIGSLPHQEVYKWLDTIDIYLQPSFTEGLSRAILEAMSRSCPVLCSNVGGNIELGREDYLFAPGSAEKIVEVISKLINTQSLIELSEYSFEKASNYVGTDLDNRRNRYLKEFMNS